MFGFLLSEKIKPVVDVGNIFFYIIIAALIVSVAAILIVFTKSKHYKVKVREEYIEKNKEYKTPVLIKVEQANAEQEEAVQKEILK